MDFDADLELDAGDAWALNQRAWFLATAADERHRNGQEALQAAQRACVLTNWSESRYLDTLAAAYAELGDFSNAVHLQMKALNLAPPGRRLGYELRLELYMSGLPYHASPRSAKPR
jgi:Flp pilus assembly protein TadD